MLSIEAVDEFRRLYLKEFGIKLTNDQALDIGTKLIRLVKVVYSSNLPKKWPKKLTEKK